MIADRSCTGLSAPSIDGTIHGVFDSMDLIARLTASVVPFTQRMAKARSWTSAFCGA